MPECLDAINEEFSDWTKSNFFAVISGVFFAVGWWIMIDSAVTFPTNDEFNHVFHICGVLSTLGFILLNTVSLSAVRGDDDDDSCSNAGPKAFFFISCVMLFASIIVSSYVLIGVYIVTGKNPIWPGIAVFLQNIFIFAGSLTYKFTRNTDID